MELKETYDLIAEDWHRDHPGKEAGDDWWVEQTDEFAALLKPDFLVLDVGCGGGFKSNYLVGKGLKVMGIDFSEKMISIAKREVPKAEFLILDMREVSILPLKFKGIFAQASLLHIPHNEIQLVVTSLVSKLESGGYFYAAVKEFIEGGVTEELKIENDYGYEYKRYFSYYTLGEFKKIMRKSGLSILTARRTKTGRSTWIQVIGQKS